MFGPLFRYELTRLARRGLQPRLRAAFAALLLVALLLAYLAAFPGVSPFRLFTEINEPLTIEAASRFGERFVVAFLVIQTLVVVLVTPALVAGAIGEEKDRRSLDLLLTTPLTDREIVVGKFAARLAFVGMLLLTGLPVVVLTIFFGGVDPAQLAAGYALALFTVCSLGAFSLAATVGRPTLGGALVDAYLFALLLSLVGLLCSCLHFPAYLSPFAALLVLLSGWPGFTSPNVPADPVSLVAWYGLLHLGLAVLFVRGAARQFREPAIAASPHVVSLAVHGPRDDDLPPVNTPQPIPVPFRLRSVPEVDDADPLGWKERYFGGAGGLPLEVILFVTGVLSMSLMLVVLPPKAVGGCAVLAVFVAGICGIAGAGVHAAGCVARERQQGTLDGLLTLPVKRRAILFAKARLAATPGVWLAVVAMVAVFIAVLRGGLAWPTLFGVPLVLAGWLAGVVGFGVWLSVRCATRERSVGWFLGLSLAACVLMPLVGRVLVRAVDGPEGLMLAFTLRGLSPIVSLWNATPTAWAWETSAAERLLFQGAVAAAVLVGVFGVAFGAAAVRDFERDSGGRSA